MANPQIPDSQAVDRNKTVTLKNIRIDGTLITNDPLDYSEIQKTIERQIKTLRNNLEIEVEDLLFLKKDQHLVIFIRIKNNNISIRYHSLEGLIRIRQLENINVEIINKIQLFEQIKELDKYEIIAPKYH